MRWLSSLLLVGALGCADPPAKPCCGTGDQADSDTDVDSDSDADTDADSGTTGTVQTATAVILGGAYGRHAASFDLGLTWPGDVQTEVDDGDGHSEGLVRGCTFGDGLFVCVGGDQTGLYEISADGLTWTRPLVGSRGWVADVAWGAGRFVSVGGFGNLAWSSDGSVWTETHQDFSTHLRQVAWGNGLFVAVGGDRRAVSADGETWIADASGFAPVDRIAFGNGVFVAVGANGQIATTADGVVWTDQVVGTASRYGVAYGAGTFLTGGWPEPMQFSADGLIWIAQDGTEQVTPAGWADGLFFAPAWRDRIWRSADGLDWELVKGDSAPAMSGFNDFAAGPIPVAVR